MKKLICASLKLLLVSFTCPCIVNAQKLPNVQEKGLRAPATIKIDGKPTEWNSQFQAYNKVTEIYYTISNDDDKLYLTVQATDLDIINKIICGGITLTINGSGKMKDQGGVAITFPALNKSTFPSADGGPLNGNPPFKLDKPENWSADTFIVVLNEKFTSKAKDIRVEGVEKIPNHLISIYNPEGIKASALFDNKTAFTYELAVPLKHLGLSVNNPKLFVYSIKLTGMDPNLNDLASLSEAIRAQRSAIRDNMILFGRPDPHMEGPNAARLYYLFSPADFWGEYTLAK